MSSGALHVSLEAKRRNAIAKLARRVLSGFSMWGRRRRTIHQLMALDDHALKDIGLHRSGIPSVANHLPVSGHHRLRMLIGTE
jgi:uncharacterized protein YjiS (DUF1127 family)